MAPTLLETFIIYHDAQRPVSGTGELGQSPAEESRNIRSEDFPRWGSAQEKSAFALRYAILAPSEQNVQPWLFHIGPDYVDVLADFSRRLPALDPENRELIIGCGAALFNLRVALRRFSCLGAVETFPDLGRPDLLARVHIGGKGPRNRLDTDLFEAIPRRHTNRHPLEQRPIPQDDLEDLRGHLSREGAWLELASQGPTRQRLLALIVLGERQLQARPSPYQEAGRQPSPSRPGIPLQNTVPGIVVKLTDSWFKSALRKFNKSQPAPPPSILQRAEEAPVLGVLKTKSDNPHSWLAAGQAMQCLLLHAHSKGLTGSFFNQPIQASSLREQLRLFGRRGHAQLILRLGHGRPAIRTPRRDLDDVLV